MDLKLRESQSKNFRYFALDLKKYLNCGKKLTKISCDRITDEGAMNVFSSFRSGFKSLQILNVNFNGCKLIGDEGLKAIGAHIGANLRNLTSLELDFAQ